MKGTGLYRSIMAQHRQIMGNIESKKFEQDRTEVHPLNLPVEQVDEEQLMETWEENLEQEPDAHVKESHDSHDTHEYHENGTAKNPISPPIKYSALRTILDNHTSLMRQIEEEEHKHRQQAVFQEEYMESEGSSEEN